MDERFGRFFREWPWARGAGEVRGWAPAVDMLDRKGMTGFDELAETYDAWYATPIGLLTDRLEREAVLSLVPEVPGRALDLSCGTGIYALVLAARGWSVIGLDRSLAMLAQARRKAVDRMRVPHYVAADITALPFRPESVDLVTLVLGLEFVQDSAAVLREARRVLGLHGSLVIAILRPWAPWNLWRRLKRRFVRSVWRNARFVARAELATALASAGFHLVACRRAVHYAPVTSSARWLARWEPIAARVAPALAAFVAVRAEPGHPAR